MVRTWTKSFGFKTWTTITREGKEVPRRFTRERRRSTRGASWERFDTGLPPIRLEVGVSHRSLHCVIYLFRLLFLSSSLSRSVFLSRKKRGRERESFVTVKMVSMTTVHTLLTNPILVKMWSKTNRQFIHHETTVREREREKELVKERVRGRESEKGRISERESESESERGRDRVDPVCTTISTLYS